MVGRALDAVMPLLCVLLCAAAALVACFSLSDSFRAKALGLWRRKFGDRGISRKLSGARFAQALAMGMSSGLPPEEAVAMCSTLLRDNPAAVTGLCQADVRVEPAGGADPLFSLTVAWQEVSAHE